MPLETASFLSDLVSSNPAHTDGLSQADSHMRLLKSTIKATFPNFTAAALVSTQAQLDAAVNASVLATAATRFLAGTAALPGLTPVGNSNTGFWSPGANILAMSVNGVEGWRLAADKSLTLQGTLSAPTYTGGTGQLVPIGAVLEWYDDVLPAEGGYAWANGQIIASANTVCPVLLARWGGRFGGNGTTTMGVPDRRNTVGVGKSTMGAVADRGLLANITSGLLTTLGSLFGSGTKTLLQVELPHVAPLFSGTTDPVTVTSTTQFDQGVTPIGQGGASAPFVAAQGFVTSTGTFTPRGLIADIQGGTVQTAFGLEQPSTTCNYILRLG